MASKFIIQIKQVRTAPPWPRMRTDVHGRPSSALLRHACCRALIGGLCCQSGSTAVGGGDGGGGETATAGDLRL